MRQERGSLPGETGKVLPPDGILQIVDVSVIV